VYELLQKYFVTLPKVKHFRNDYNQDCYRNKKTAIELATNKWCCLWDSDNVFNIDYLDRIFEREWDNNTIYTPGFAAPHFDFRRYEGLIITKENVSAYIDLPMFETMLNANNFFVNREEYLKAWDGSVDPVTSDSIFMCYNWLKSGRKIMVVPGLTYQHTVHPGSHYVNNNHRTAPGLHESILHNFREMK
jgi:glycosyltransferase involved in cell wall biosynthesis